MLAAASGPASAAPATASAATVATAQSSMVSAMSAAASASILSSVATAPAAILPSVAAAFPTMLRQSLPLPALVEIHKVGAPLDEEANCLATAVYFEARGESLEGQLAVARVVMNRAASGKYPTSWCEVVKQPWQFSFVRNRSWPAIRDIGSWQKAVGVARIAMNNAAESVPTDVLWYHADYVAPSWGRRLTQVDKIGVHIFYRA